MIEVTSFPDRAFLERGVFRQSVNVEFRFRSLSTETLELYDVTVDGFDGADKLLFELPLNNFGLVPPILNVPERRVEPSGLLEVFNPLPDFPLEYTIRELDYRFKFRGEKGAPVTCGITLHPMVYPQKASLMLPFAGACLVTEGHDLLTHHRRNFPSTHLLVKQIGITGNNSRFAYDFVLVNDRLRMYEGQPERNENCFCWGKPVLCPGDGTVASAANDLEDNALYTPPDFDVEAHLRDPEGSMARHMGNHVIIDHGKGEFSMIAHMKKGSVKALAGDRVAKGVVIGQVGTSGDSFFPHIHYQVQDGASLLTSEGLPSRFDMFDLIIGDRTRRIENSCPNTGMLIKHES